jgi:hypothetical protein
VVEPSAAVDRSASAEKGWRQTLSLAGWFIGIVALTSCVRAPVGQSNAEGAVPYLGLTTPGETPERFAPGIVSTDAIELNSVFSPDGREFFFTRLIDGEDKLQYPGNTRPVMHHIVFENGQWSAPAPLLLYPDRSKALAVDMSLSPDGHELYFMGRHPQGHAPESPSLDLWVSRKEDGAWSTARVLPPPVNSTANEVYSSVVADGSLYFTSNRPVAGGAGRSALYRAQRLPDGSFAAPVDVGPPVNDTATGDAFVATDESYVVFASGGRGGFGQGDLFVSFRQPDGGWGQPVNLGETVNTEHTEFCPMVTPDGRYLFFSRRWGATWNEATAGDVFWVDARILDRFRPR